ncbi:hypothetical protein LJC48_00035 [Desulfovibrio sp. OttesenSCG-928-C06]|nr:hypothetical protein [Desulfovibrio sp. OttesenSCG-928-C06]
MFTLSRKFLIFFMSAIVFGACSFSGSLFAFAGEASSKPGTPIDYKVEKIIFSILKSTTPGSEPPPVEDIRILLDFMMTCRGRGEDYNPEKYAGGAGIFWRESINKPLPEVLRYFYNPNINQELLYPSSIRVNRVSPDSGIFKLEKPVWESLDELESPISFWNREHEEITPDDFSGSYYSYELDRLFVLFRYLDQPMLLTISWQDGESDLGRKAGILGPYENWDFVYSNAEGGTATGIGWAETHMYSSATITLMYPEGDNGEGTGYSMFKWLKAGWAGMNVVKPKHIYSGADRTFSGIKDVVCSERSITPEQLEKIVTKVRAMDDVALRAVARPYAEALAAGSTDDSILSREEFQDVLAGGDYAEGLSREHLEALVMKNELKRLLGKTVLGDAAPAPAAQE